MCDGIALTWRDLPDVLISRHKLEERIVSPGNEADQQIHFLRQQRPRLLPVWYEGQLQVVPWGADSPPLPTNGICKQESLDRGTWSHLRPESVIIPAPLVKDGGRWFDVKEGIRGVVVRDRLQQLHAYLLTMPATHYYHNMTRRQRMPVFVASDF